MVGIDPDRIETIFREKMIWPMPSKCDGLPNWQERLNKVLLAGYSEWKAPRSLMDQDPRLRNPTFLQGLDVVQSTKEVIHESDEETDYETDEDY